MAAPGRVILSCSIFPYCCGG